MNRQFAPTAPAGVLFLRDNFGSVVGYSLVVQNWGQRHEGVRSPRFSQTVSHFNINSTRLANLVGSGRSFSAVACVENGIFDFPRGY
jgi:hypothetical protein